MDFYFELHLFWSLVFVQCRVDRMSNSRVRQRLLQHGELYLRFALLAVFGSGACVNDSCDVELIPKVLLHLRPS